eukprot:symbB.v1.2.029822.t2/scaffold3305.1/size59406/3
MPEGAPGLALQSSSLHGLGVFAENSFLKGDVLEKSPCLWIAKASIPVHHAKKSDSIDLLDYLFDPQGSVSKSSSSEERLLLPLGFGLSYNHSEDANASYKVYLDDPPLLLFRAIRDISCGEEVLIDYGREWWLNRGWQPLSHNSAMAVDSSKADGKLEENPGDAEMQRKVQLLSSMGFEKTACFQALEAAGGDADVAANQLLAERLIE